MVRVEDNTIMAEKLLLKNGLTVLVEEVPHLSVAAIQCGFKVGSIYEREDEAGICHLIEHMLFKGTKKRPKAGQIAYDAESIGADINAFTSFENTVYHLTLSSRYFSEGLEILVDLVRDPLFDAKELEREKEVVCEEIRRGEDSPTRVISELLFKTAFRQHPYRLPIIGTAESVKSFSAEKIRSFYKEWYNPQNAVLLVVSNVPTQTVFKMVAQHCETWQGNAPIHPLLPAEIRREHAGLVWTEKDIEGTYFDMAWSIPEFIHPDVPALDLLSHILGEGGASRLETEVKEKKHLVQSIYSYAYTPKDPGLFVVGGMTAEKNLKRALHHSIAEIRNIQEKGVSEEEIRRARLNLMSDIYYEKQTADGIARKLMFFECTAADLMAEKLYYERLAQVDHEDVQAVAQQYLTENTLALVVLTKEKQKFDISDLALRTDLVSQVLPVPSKYYAQKGNVRDISLYSLKNGVRILLRPTRHLPLIAMRAGVPGGLLRENKETNGAAHLISRLLTKGTEHRSNEEIAVATEKIAGDASGFSGRHSLGLYAQMLASQATLGFDLFFDILKNAQFSESHVERERFLTLEAIRQESDSPASLVWKHFLKTLFPNHPYGMPSLGEIDTVNRLAAKDLKTMYHQFLSSEDLIFSIVGDFKEDWVLRHIEDHCMDLPKRELPFEIPATDPPLDRPVHTEVVLKKEQAHIVLGFRGPSIKSPDRFALSILNTVLAGQGGRLFLELRDKRSLAYTVTSYVMEGISPGLFALYIACDPNKIDEAVKGMKQELEKICNTTISPDELNRAKHQLVSGYEMDLQRYSAIANQLFANELLGLPLDTFYTSPKNFEAVTAEEVLQTAKHYIDLDRYVLAVLRP